MAKLALLLAVYTTAAMAHPSDWGRFNPPEPKVQFLQDDRALRLLEDLVYTDSAGNNWIAPRGGIIDGSSIPQVFWAIAGSPIAGPYRNAAIVHNAYCTENQRRDKHDSDLVHLIFYHAMLCDGIPKPKAAALYWGAVNFGPSWQTKVSRSGKLEAGPVVHKFQIPEGKADQKKMIDWAIEYFERHPDLSPCEIQEVQPLIQ